MPLKLPCQHGINHRNGTCQRGPVVEQLRCAFDDGAVPGRHANARGGQRDFAWKIGIPLRTVAQLEQRQARLGELNVIHPML